MITLNLLDNKRKKHYLFRRVLLTIQKSIELLFFMALLIGIIFSTSQYYLQKTLEEVTEQSVLINKKIGGFNEETAQLNQLIKNVKNIQEEYIPWSPVLIKTTQAIPENIKINSLKISKQESQLNLQGIAKNRETLLKLRNNLENLYFVEKIDSPLSNLLKKEDVNFNLIVYLNTDKLLYD